MKTIKTLCVSIFLTGAMACGQKNETPKAVTDAFAKKFPSAKSVKWNKESSIEWEAEFKMDKVEYSANFESDGTWKETEHEIKISDVPEKIKAALIKEHASFKIKETEISETVSGKYYKFEIKKDKTVLEISIDNQGVIINKNSIEDNEKENDDQ